MHLTMHTAGSDEAAKDRTTVERAGDGLRATFTMREGESGRGIVLESMGGEPKAMTSAELNRLADDTAAYWKGWLGRSTYTGRWREMVTRSAMTLKLLTYEPTGAPVAAATFGLPEQAGGERNWDYRFTWIRDGSLTMHALASLGYLEEAGRFGAWLRDRVTEHAGSASGPLKIMYRVDGSSDLTEETLDHFEGWRGSRPVRIGNGAADQLQLDIYGEAMDAILTRSSTGCRSPTRAGRRSPRSSTGSATTGTSPTKGSGRPAAAARTSPTAGSSAGSRSTGRSGWPSAPAARPTSPSGPSSGTGCTTRSWSAAGIEKAGAFTQHYGTDVLDSSLLLMPLEGFIEARDPMWLSTLRAMDKELVSDSLVYRYNPAASPDGLHGDEGTFSLCTFLYVDALASAGRLDDAVLTFEKMQTYGNHLGLFSEEIGSTGEQLGNFPQAFTHLSLINAAITLNGELDRRAAYAEPVTVLAG